MEKQVLVYEFKGLRLGQMSKALEKLPCKMRVVEREEYGMPLGYLAGLENKPVAGKRYAGEGLEQEMVGFAGFVGEDIDMALKAFCEHGLAGVGLKAVVTETNRGWNSLQLFEELKKEHAMMHGK